MDTRLQQGIIGFLLFVVGKENQTANFICKWSNSLICKTVVRSAFFFFFLFFFFLAWHTCHCNLIKVVLCRDTSELICSSWTSWFNFYESVWFINLRINLIQTWGDDRYNYTLHFNAGLPWYLDSRSQECKRAKISFASISWSIQSVWMEFCMLLRILVWSTSYSLYVIHAVFRWKNPTLVISFKKRTTLMLACTQTCTDCLCTNLIW